MPGERRLAGIIRAAQAPRQNPVVGLFLDQPFVQQRVHGTDARGRGLERDPQALAPFALMGKEVELRGGARGREARFVRRRGRPGGRRRPGALPRGPKAIRYPGRAKPPPYRPTPTLFFRRWRHPGGKPPA
jgi:hypothetical protein